MPVTNSLGMWHTDPYAFPMQRRRPECPACPEVEAATSYNPSRLERTACGTLILTLSLGSLAFFAWFIVVN